MRHTFEDPAAAASVQAVCDLLIAFETAPLEPFAVTPLALRGGPEGPRARVIVRVGELRRDLEPGEAKLLALMLEDDPPVPPFKEISDLLARRLRSAAVIAEETVNIEAILFGTDGEWTGVMPPAGGPDGSNVIPFPFRNRRPAA